MERVVKTARSLVVALLPLALFVHEADTSTTQGEAIFQRAVRVAENDSYADYASYSVAVSFVNGAHHVSDTWNTIEDIEHRAVIADVFSREERRSPSTPHGSNLRLSLSLSSGGLGDPAVYRSAPLNPPSTDDPIGPVAMAVDQNFGLTPPHTYHVTYDVDSLAATAPGFAVIGRSETQVARYRATLLDVNATTDHIALVPLRDPYHNRLREIWVDAETAHIREAVVTGVGDRAPLDHVRWDVTFARIGDATYVAEERALEPIDYGRDEQLRDARITFDQLALLAALPFPSTFGISTPIQTVHDP